MANSFAEEYIARVQAALAGRAPEPRIIKETYYTYPQPHHDECAPFWSEDDKRQKKAHYWLFEVPIQVEINLDTAEIRIIGCAGKPLVEPTKWE